MTIGMKAFLLLEIIAANLPFLSAKLFIVVRVGKSKPLFVILFELIAYYCMIGVLARFMETQSYGAAYEQGTRFYMIGLIMFLIFAFPGFMLRYSQTK